VISKADRLGGQADPSERGSVGKAP